MSLTQEKTILSDVIGVTKGKPPIVIPYHGEGAEPYLSPEFLRGNAPVEMAKAGTNAVKVEDEDIILLWDGSNAGEFFKARKGLLASTMARLSHNNDFDRGYFFYAIKRWESYLKGQTSGSGIPHVDKEVLEKLEILRFPKPEQIQIAKILSTIDRAIEQTEAIIAKQQRIKTGLMQDLLTRGIDAHGNIRTEATHEFKGSPLCRIPVEWEVCPFGNRVLSSAFGPRFSGSAYSQQGNIATLRTTDLDDDGNISYKTMPLAELSEKEFTSHILQQNDFLLTRSGTCGVPAIFEDFVLPVLPGAFLVRFRLNQELVNPFYLKFYFNWETGRSRLLDLAEGGVQKNIRGSSVNQMLFAFPKLDEQIKVVEVLKAQENTIKSEMNQLLKLRQVKTGLMQDLLTGKVRVTNLPEKAQGEQA